MNLIVFNCLYNFSPLTEPVRIKIYLYFIHHITVQPHINIRYLNTSACNSHFTFVQTERKAGQQAKLKSEMCYQTPLPLKIEQNLYDTTTNGQFGFKLFIVKIFTAIYLIIDLLLKRQIQL